VLLDRVETKLLVLLDVRRAVMPPHPAQIIKQAPIFSALSDEETRRLSELANEVLASPGQVFCLEDEPGDRFYIVLDGEVEIVKALGKDDERHLATRGPGEFFGEMSLLDPDGLCTASVRARTPLRLLEMARADFNALLQGRPDLAYQILRVLSLRLRESDNATIAGLREKNRELAQAYADLKAAQAQIIEKEKLEQELRTAHRIQQSILPGKLPRLAGYDFGALMMPARSVGGDLYDFIPLGKDKLGVAIGDVSDKGVPAAIFMALTCSLLRAEATRAASPRKVLERVNRLLLDMNDEGMFVTLLYGVLDSQQRTFTYARAGHELPLLLNADGSAGFAMAGQGLPLGLFDLITLDEQIIPLSQGDSFLLYTDGATDMTDAPGTLFGIEQLEAVASGAIRGRTAQDLCEEIWRSLAAHRGTSMQADDVALVAIRALRGRQ
jgi:sigma-B regulation protein RsbU (phosphoserine phosphatase)